MKLKRLFENDDGSADFTVFLILILTCFFIFVGIATILGEGDGQWGLIYDSQIMQEDSQIMQELSGYNLIGFAFILLILIVLMIERVMEECDNFDKWGDCRGQDYYYRELFG